MTNRFIGKSAVKKTNFMDTDLEIRKLSVNQVLQIRAVTKEFEADENGGIHILSKVIRCGAPELADLTMEDFQDFPIESLTVLSEEIMVFSGLMEKPETKV